MARDSAHAATSLCTCAADKYAWVISFDPPTPIVAFFKKWES
jgi:hypothetical protein